MCEVPDLSMHAWTFVYFGYSKKALKTYYYLKANEYECKMENEALHAISDHYKVFVGSDNIVNRF